MALVLAGLMGGPAGAGDRPARVVSTNLCTDQLAMLVAGAGQLHSVSYLAADPRSSSMPEAAAAYPLNHGRAEEIYLMRPDLVLSGGFATRATTDMLRRLGIRVVVFQPASSLDDVRDRLTRMGEVLGREDRAAELVAAFDARLAALRATDGNRPSAALYAANGYTSGNGSLAGQILATAGFDNIADEAGYPNGGAMPLEVLAMARPDAIVASRPYPGRSRAESVLDHPALAAIGAARGHIDADWSCGTPHVLDAVAEMRALRRGIGDDAP